MREDTNTYSERIVIISIERYVNLYLSTAISLSEPIAEMVIS